MSIPERLGVPVEVFWSGLLVWIIVTVWIITFISWMIMAELEVLTGTLGLGVAAALGYFAMKPPVPWVSPTILFAMIIVSCTFPIARSALNRRALEQIEIEQAEKAYAALLNSPQSMGTGLKLARFLYERGLIHHAHALLQSLLTGANRRIYFEEFKTIQFWESQAEGSRAPAELRCFKCGHHNPCSAMKCQNCGAAYLRNHIRHGWGVGFDLSKLLAIVLMLIMLTVTIPLSATALPPAFGLVAVILQIGLGGLIAFRAWVGK